MHDTNQLMRCGLADEDISPLFLGVFPADKLPFFFPLKNWIFIANTDPSGQPGKHWVSFFILFSILMERNLLIINRTGRGSIHGNMAQEIFNNFLAMSVVIGVCIGELHLPAFQPNIN